MGVSGFEGWGARLWHRGLESGAWGLELRAKSLRGFRGVRVVYRVLRVL